MFSNDPIPRPAGRPASSTPLGDYLNGARHGVDGSYAVLPRSLAESMSLPWQQQMMRLLAEFHQAYGHVPWPVYRVVPSRYERLVDLDEDQLAEVGCLVEIDSDGELVYRERNGQRIADPESRRVLVSCLDPIPKQAVGHVPPSPPPPVPPLPPLPSQQQGAAPLPPPPPLATPPGGQPRVPAPAGPPGAARDEPWKPVEPEPGYEQQPFEPFGPTGRPQQYGQSRQQPPW